MNTPRLLQTYLLDGSIKGVRIIELSESPIKAFVVPRIKLNDIKARDEVNWPSLYLLINSGDNQLYIGESEKFYDRVKNHDQSKDFWDIAIAVVSSSNTLEKSDVKYLESMAIEKAQATAAMEVINRTVPGRNNIHEFKVHTLEKILEDTALITESLGFSVLKVADQNQSELWYITSKKTHAIAEFRGDKIVVLKGSKIDGSTTKSWERNFPNQMIERVIKLADHADEDGGVHTLRENLPFDSPSRASGFVKGSSSNGWVDWKNETGKTMDEVIRQDKSK